jgi:GT2 family glycosyltransferase
LQVGIVVLNYNNYNQTKCLVDKIKCYEIFSRIIVVDNCSRNESYKELKKLESDKIKVIQTTENKGYASGNNIGVKYLEEMDIEVVFIANPDVYFDEIVITRIIEEFELSFRMNKNYALISAIRTDGENNFTQRQFWKIPKLKDEILYSFFLTRKIIKKKEIYKITSDAKIYDVEVVPGCFFGVRLDVFKELGYFDENTFLFYEENILAFKLRTSNYKAGLVLDVTYKHIHENSSTLSLAKSSKAVMITNKSTLYFHKTYSKLSHFSLLILKSVMFYRIVERTVLISAKKMLTLFSAKED